MKRALFIVALVSLVAAGTVQANEGIYAGAGFVYNRTQSSDIDFINSATGLDLKAGYNFGPVALEVNLIGSKHAGRKVGYGDTNFGGMSIDLRVPFSQPGQPNQFYVLTGLGGYSLKGYDPTAASEVKYSGGGFDLGAGVEHFFNQHLAFNLAGIYRAIQYDKKEVQGNTVTLSPKINGDILSVEAGVVYYFK